MDELEQEIQRVMRAELGVTVITGQGPMEVADKAARRVAALVDQEFAKREKALLEGLREDHSIIPKPIMAFKRQQDWSDGWTKSWQHQMKRIDRASNSLERGAK